MPLDFLSFSWVTLFSATWLDLVLLGAGWSRSKLCVCVCVCVGGGGGEGGGVGVRCSTPPLHTTCTREERLGMLNSSGQSKLTSPDFICGRNWHDRHSTFLHELRIHEVLLLYPISESNKNRKESKPLLFQLCIFRPTQIMNSRWTPWRSLAGLWRGRCLLRSR